MVPIYGRPEKAARCEAQVSACGIFFPNSQGVGTLVRQRCDAQETETGLWGRRATDKQTGAGRSSKQTADHPGGTQYNIPFQREPRYGPRNPKTGQNWAPRAPVAFDSAHKHNPTIAQLRVTRALTPV